jgi:hypothetical protein
VQSVLLQGYPDLEYLIINGRGESRLYTPGFLLGLAVVALFLWLAIAYFRHTERSFADLI